MNKYCILSGIYRVCKIQIQIFHEQSKSFSVRRFRSYENTIENRLYRKFARDLSSISNSVCCRECGIITGTKIITYRTI